MTIHREISARRSLIIIIIIIIHLYSVFSQGSKNASQKGNYNYKLPMTIKINIIHKKYKNNVKFSVPCKAVKINVS